jgi:hypothetical protein
MLPDRSINLSFKFIALLKLENSWKLYDDWLTACHHLVF